MRHTLIRRFTVETHRLRRKDTDNEDPEERSVVMPLAGYTSGNGFSSGLTHGSSTRKKSVQLLGKRILGSLNQ